MKKQETNQIKSTLLVMKFSETHSLWGGTNWNENIEMCKAMQNKGYTIPVQSPNNSRVRVAKLTEAGIRYLNEQ